VVVEVVDELVKDRHWCGRGVDGQRHMEVGSYCLVE
jgi:hypothetical protein